jgi:adenylate cyclase
MAVLCYLADRPGKVISREELEDEIWRGTVVGYDALSNTIIKLRRTFGDNARNPTFIETIAKTGYRLIAPVKPADEPMEEHSSVEEISTNDPIDPLSIAVLAFDDLSKNQDQEYFSDGISEDITTDLSKVPGLKVIARNSAFAYKGKMLNACQIGRELSVRYLLEGSIRIVDKRVRINAQLIDTNDGGHRWADRYDHDISNIFVLQDEITRAIVRSLIPNLGLPPAEAGTARKPDIRAYDFFLKGRQLSLQDTSSSNRQARKLLQRAIEIDPAFSLAYSHLGRCLGVAHINNWGASSNSLLQDGIELARAAIELDPRNAHAHMVIAANGFWLRRYDLALQEAKKSLAIDPNYAEGYGVLSMIRVYSGQPEKGLDSLRHTRRLDPHYRDIYLYYEALARFHLGDHRASIAALQRRLVRKQESDITHMLLAANYGYLGQQKEAREEWSRLERVNPGFRLLDKIDKLPYRQESDLAYFVEGLRLGGVAPGRGNSK